MSFGDKLLRYVEEVQFCLKVGVRSYDRTRLAIGTLLFHLSNLRQYGVLNKKLYKLKGRPYRVNINNVTQDIYLRPFSGDFFIFHEIFLDEPYNLPNHVLEDAEVIVDLGSNIGMTTLYFAGKAHNAKFYCVEPDPNNLAILRHNLSNVRNNVNILEGAISNRVGSLRFEVDAPAWGRKVTSKNNIKSIRISSFSIPFIMNKFNIDSIDILKVDIEGAEKVLFDSNKDWLSKVKVILIELHQGYSVPDLEKDISEYGFNLYEPGSSKGNNILMAARS